MTQCLQSEWCEHQATVLARSTPGESITIALAGQPNVGKSTVFNRLTGLNQHVGNWPGKTVEQKRGVLEYSGQAYTLIDLPGTYSLTANSEEERITRDFIIQERPDVVVALVDAAIMERSLYLLSELLLLPVPVILVLNMMDVAAQEGIQVEPKVLEAALELPVVAMCATKNQGYEVLLETINRLMQGEIVYQPRRPTILSQHEQVLGKLITLVADWVPEPYPKDWVALKLLEGDEEVADFMHASLPPEQWKQTHALLLEHEDAILDIAGARYAWIARMVRAAVVRPRVGQVGLTARLDRVLTHPLMGMGVLLGVLALVFWLTYAIGTPLQAWLGMLTEDLVIQVHRGLASAPLWLADLVADGILGGAGMVVTFLPILVIFFAVLGILEDTGYMARAAYLTDRFMHMMGLHGKSFMPLLLGFGCNVPAVLGSRIIETRRARILTILLAPLVPCTARMAVITVLAPLFFGAAAGWISWGLVVTNLVILSLVGILFHRFVLQGEQTVFIMELPLYHLPNARTIGLYIWQNVLAFLQKAGTVILVASVIVWALSYFPSGDVASSYLAQIGAFLEPLGQCLGVPWPFMVALLTSFVAKENTIATLGVLYGNLETVLPSVLSPAAALAFLVVQMLFIPCVATVAAVKQETASWKWTIVSLSLMIVISLAAGILVYQLGTWVGG
ncbi:MAG: ferrous iron transport protein B [Anaerolineae bacterium]|nr:ferrous iron transport protein B [Anaerolineae bacterium]